MTHFAGADLVKRVVAAEVFHAWAKRKGDAALNPDSKESSIADPEPSAPAATVPSNAEGVTHIQNSDAGGQLSPEPTPLKPATESSGAGLTVGAEIDLAVGREEGIDSAVIGAPLTHAVAVCSAQFMESKPLLELTDDEVVTLAGPASVPEGPRVEIKLTAGELRKIRQCRVFEFRQLLVEMLYDPTVQIGELDVVVSAPTCPTPMLTESNSSGAAAAAARAQEMSACTLAYTPRRMIQILPSGQELDLEGLGSHTGGGSAVSHPVALSNREEAGGQEYNTHGGGFNGGLMSVHAQKSTVSEEVVSVAGGEGGSWENPVLEGGKRAREVGDDDGGGKRTHRVGLEGKEDGHLAPATGGATGVESARQEGCVELSGLADASKRRRQLWMLAIRENELRHERKLAEAKRYYEARQQALLQWMIDEEAGRHNHSDGDAGPPPMEEIGEGGS